MGAEPVVTAGLDTAHATAPDRRESTLAFVGRAIHPSDASTEVFERIVEDKGETGGPARHSTGAIPVVRRSALTDPVAQVAEFTGADAAAADDEAWSPVPVPRPTYTMKPSAPRREPAPLENLEGSTAARTPVEVPAEDRAPLEAPVETTGSIDLNAVLAKRRAAGE